MLPTWTAFALIPLYALADRFAGGGWPKLDAMLPGRGAFWAALACIAAGYVAAGPFGASCGLVWFAWRTPGWDIFGGSMDPRGARQIAGTFARHLIAAPLLGLAAYWTGGDYIQAVVGGAVFAVAATALAIRFAKIVDDSAGYAAASGNEQTELLRGAAFGSVVAALVLLG